LRTGDAGGAVNEDEDHATEGPSDAQNAYPVALGVTGDGGVALSLVSDDGQDGDVKEEEGGYEFGYGGSVQGPLGELIGVDQRRRRWVVVVLGGVFGLLRDLLNVFGHCKNRNSAKELQKKKIRG